jgi:putative flippase GtrA
MVQIEAKTWRADSQWRRWLAFNSVGFLGVGVQLAILTALASGLGWNYLLSTVLAVEAAILHNFVWHERWTWIDQTFGNGAGRFGRLGRFHVANGAISLVGNLLLMWLFVGMFRISNVVANLCAITICSLVNFFASDRWVFRERGEHMVESRETLDPTCPWKNRMSSFAIRISLLAVGFWMVQGVRLEAAQLRPETVKAWTAYANVTERRIESELRAPQGFLVMDLQSPTAAAAERSAILAGEIPVTKMKTFDLKGGNIKVPSGMIHHWRGSVFIPGVDINFVLSRVSNPSVEDTRQEDVMDSRVLQRGSDSLTLFLKLRRVKFVTVVYNTEHAVRYGWRGQTQAFSRSVATRIAEVENANSAAELEKPIGQDRGFLWRLNSYWRYEQVAGGVIVECESISLSRTVPGFLETLIRPLIDSAARESMSRTLGSMRDRMTRAVRQQKDLTAKAGTS